MTAPLVIASAWTLWCLLHSLLICRSLIAFFGRILGRRIAFFRLSYNFFSLISATAIFFLQLRLPQQQFLNWHGGWRLLQGGILLYALFMFAAGARVYDLGYFTGISQIRDYFGGKSPSGVPFSRKGILHAVRHPWYSGGLALLFGMGGFSDVSLAAKIVLSTYLVIGTVMEEKKLLVELGEEYALYRRQVPMLLPWKALGEFLRGGLE